MEIKEKELQNLYKKYLKQWKNDHKGIEYKGMSPACFNEWFDCEYTENL